MNVKRVQKCIANKLANMTDKEKHDWKMKKQQSNRKGQATFVAKQLKQEEEAFKVAVTEGAQALYVAWNTEAFTAAVSAGAQILYDAEYIEAFARDVTAKAMLLAKAMFDKASDNPTAAAIGVTAAVTNDTAEVTNMDSIVAEEQNFIVCTQTPKYNLGKLVLTNNAWTGEDYEVVHKS